MKIIIYKITILTTGKSYIGETNNLVRHISQHKCCAKDRCTNRKGMYVDWINGSIDNYSVEVLDTFEFTSQEDSWKRESLYIEKFNTECCGYNVAYYGCKTRVSKLKGRPLSPERRIQLRENHFDVSGIKNPSANRYYISDNDGNNYICECREDIVKQLGVSFKQAKRIISHIGEWYTTRIHKDNKYIVGKSFKLLKVEKIN